MDEETYLSSKKKKKTLTYASYGFFTDAFLFYCIIFYMRKFMFVRLFFVQLTRRGTPASKQHTHAKSTERTGPPRAAGELEVAAPFFSRIAMKQPQPAARTAAAARGKVADRAARGRITARSWMVPSFLCSGVLSSSGSSRLLSRSNQSKV